MKINTYGCTAELNDYGSNNMAGIGTACHEFSHCLGLPDIYDTSGGDCLAWTCGMSWTMVRMLAMAIVPLAITHTSVG